MIIKWNCVLTRGPSANPVINSLHQIWNESDRETNSSTRISHNTHTQISHTNTQIYIHTQIFTHSANRHEMLSFHVAFHLKVFCLFIEIEV